MHNALHKLATPPHSSNTFQLQLGQAVMLQACAYVCRGWRHPAAIAGVRGTLHTQAGCCAQQCVHPWRRHRQPHVSVLSTCNVRLTQATGKH